MMTNIIAYLHTTLAYQSAAMQLMVGQANYDAQQLHLREALPIAVPANTNTWSVAMPPDGVTGGFATSNYVYRFSAGKVAWIQKKPRPRGAAGDAAENLPSLVDTNGAYQLATQWLAAVAVDVPALESKYPHSVVQLGVRPSVVRNRPGGTNRVVHQASTSFTTRSKIAPPLFRVAWGGGRGTPTALARTALQVSVEILGSTKECTSLRIQNPEWIKAPPLQVTNAAALLGTPPPPQHFVEEFLGGRTAYDTVAKPDRVMAWLLSSQTDEPEGKTNRTAAVSVDANTSAQFSRTLTDFNSYSWIDEKSCAPDYGVRLQFIKGGDNLEIRWCYQCDHLQVTHNGQSAEKDCDAARVALVQAVKSIFPKDEAIKNLSLLNPNSN
jgi:hypothetical protein